VNTTQHAPQPRPRGLIAELANSLTHVVIELLQTTAHIARNYSHELAAAVLVSTLLTATACGPIYVGWPLLTAALTAGYYGRHRIANANQTAKTKRAWRRAMNDVELNDKCRHVRPAAAGQKLDVIIAPGHAVTGLEAKAEEIAASLQAQEIRVQRDRDNARRATITIVRQDPFRDLPPVKWPGLNPASTPTVWEPIRIGTSEDGDPQTLKLIGNQILIGGTTGGGKSMLMRSILGTIALDPAAKLWLFDAKLIELTPWAGAAEYLVDDDGDKALSTLQHLKELTDKRQREILAAPNGWDKITRASGLPVHTIVIDELGEYATMEQGKEFLRLLASIARRGRALGISVVAATQSPYADVIPSELRTQFKTRIVFRCMDRGHASTIVGNTPIAQLAADIDPDLPGVGYSLDENGTFTRFRTVLVTRPDPDDHPDWVDDVKQVVDRAKALRVNRAPVAELAGLSDSADANAHTPTGYVERDVAATPVRAVKPGNKTTGVNGKPRKTRTPELMQPIMDAWDGEPLTQSGLARLVGRKPTDGSVRRAVTALEKQGFIVRNEDGLWVKTTK
jgi:hypothetical protein